MGSVHHRLFFGFLVMCLQVTFVGDGFTRKPPKFERFIRPRALRFKKVLLRVVSVFTPEPAQSTDRRGLQAHVCHPELQCTFYLDIIGVKKNPQSPLYTSLGVITKGVC
jgi:ribosome biogenesis protein NSA2